MTIELVATTTSGEEITLISHEGGDLTTLHIDKTLFDPVEIESLKLTVVKSA